MDAQPGLGAANYKVKEVLGDQKLRIVDSSAGGAAAKEAFHESSIPHARFMNVMGDLKDPNGQFPNTFPSADIVTDVMQSIGVAKDDHLVIYAHPGKHVGVTRAFFILDSYGFNVKILNGGLYKYTDEGYPTVEGKDYTGKPSKITGLKYPSDSLVSLEDIKDFQSGSSDFQLIDVRPADAFNGKATDNIDGCRQGKVEGAVNILPGEFLHKDFTFKCDGEISDLLEKHNLDPAKQTVVMCRTGMAATIGIAALRSATSLPFENIKLYDGSWSEFGTLA